MYKKRTAIKQITSDHIFDIVNYILLILLDIIMLYPFIYVLSTSISDPGEILHGNVYFLPKGFDLSSYKLMISHPLFISSYLNTILYAVSGTILVLIVTSMSAYALARPKFYGKGFILMLYVITMFFGGGMIPTFLVIKNLHMFDTRWAMILPGVVSAWNLIIIRSFFKTIPESLYESAYLDGASDWKILWSIIIPLSKPALSTIGLFTMVGYWNDFFSALLYLNDSGKYPIQMILRMILISSTFSKGADSLKSTDMLSTISTESLKSASIVITMLPIMCVYPFIQKYFVKGVMIGSIKG